MRTRWWRRTRTCLNRSPSLCLPQSVCSLSPRRRVRTRWWRRTRTCLNRSPSLCPPQSYCSLSPSVSLFSLPQASSEDSLVAAYQDLSKQIAITLSPSVSLFSPQASSEDSLVAAYQDLSKQIAITLRHEEKRCDYVSQQKAAMLTIQDEAAAMTEGTAWVPVYKETIYYIYRTSTSSSIFPQPRIPLN